MRWIDGVLVHCRHYLIEFWLGTGAAIRRIDASTSKLFHRQRVRIPIKPGKQLGFSYVRGCTSTRPACCAFWRVTKLHHTEGRKVFDSIIESCVR